MNTYLMTGGTGYFGSKFVIQLLKNKNKVIFLTRNKKNVTAEERILRSIKGIDISLIKTIEFDIEKDSTISIDNLKIDGIWHFAASLNFQEKDRNNTISTNVNGIKNIIKLATVYKCPIYHISTAYINGKKTGEIFERINLEEKITFNNPYEESKLEAEKIIYEWGKKKGNNFIIFRVSILVGGENTLSYFFGYYMVLCSFYKFKKLLYDIRKKSKLYRILIYKNGTILSIPIFWLTSKKAFLNLISVDTASKLILEIFNSNKPIMGKIFNIVNPNPPSMKYVVKYLLKGLGMKFPVFKTSRFFSNIFLIVISKILSIFKKSKKIANTLNTYKYYMNEFNVYNTSNVENIIGLEKFKSYFKEQHKDFIYFLAKDYFNKIENESIYNKK